MQTGALEHPEIFRAASPTYRVQADAPPFFVLHGRNDTLVPVAMARAFVDALRAASRAPVAYAELPLAQHAFDVLASLRCQATTNGVAAFLDAARVRATAPQPPLP
jgi:acetyl esterase/lipase